MRSASAAARELAERNSWESIVEAMENHIANAIADKLPAASSGAA